MWPRGVVVVVRQDAEDVDTGEGNGDVVDTVVEEIIVAVSVAP